MYPLIDFHCHLDLYENPNAVTKACGDSSNYILSVTTTPKAWFGTSRLASNHKRIKTALGLHPQLAGERYNELGLFDSLVNETKYIGEIGLDGSPSLKESQLIQTNVFTHILKKTNASSPKILTIHSLKAVDPVLNILNKQFNNGIPVLHWFTGNQSQLKHAIDIGCWFSINSRMLKTEKGKLLVGSIPRNIILTETDGPFILHKNTPVMPARVEDAVQGLANIWSISYEDASAQIYNNFKQLLTYL